MDPSYLNPDGLSLFSYLASVQKDFIARIIHLCRVTSRQELLGASASKDLHCYLPHVYAIL